MRQRKKIRHTHLSGERRRKENHKRINITNGRIRKHTNTTANELNGLDLDVMRQATAATTLLK